MLGKFGSRIGHTFKGSVSEGITDKMVVGGKLHTNVDINRDNPLSRFMNDEKGFGGSKHADKALAEISHYKTARRDLKDGRREMDALTTMRNGSTNEAERGILDTSIGKQKEYNINAAKEKSLMGTAAGVAKHTFNGMNTGTAGQIAGKWGAVAGTGMAVAGAGRAVTGGGVTYNSSGQRDIMGIPLI